MRFLCCSAAPRASPAAAHDTSERLAGDARHAPLSAHEPRVLPHNEPTGAAPLFAGAALSRTGIWLWLSEGQQWFGQQKTTEETTTEWSYNRVWMPLRWLLHAGVVVKAEASTTLTDGVLRTGVQTGFKKRKQVVEKVVGKKAKKTSKMVYVDMPQAAEGHSGSRTNALFCEIGPELLTWLTYNGLQELNLLYFSIVICMDLKMRGERDKEEVKRKKVTVRKGRACV